MAMVAKFVPLLLGSSSPCPGFRPREVKPSFANMTPSSIRCAKRSQRTGKQRYPSEKKKLKTKYKTLEDVKNKDEVFGGSVSSGFRFTRILERTILAYPMVCLKHLLRFSNSRTHEGVGSSEGACCSQVKESNKFPIMKRPKIAVVGSGPSGLFASLVLAELGAEITLIESGQAVEQRGRDLGALMVRRILQSESNFCFGEGGAGTWSDGKLVTRIGKNSDSVQAVMRTLVHFGAPQKILVDGKPHLGTDRLVPLLKSFQQYLRRLGVSIKFGTRVDNLVVEHGQVVGVKISDARNVFHSDSQKLECDAVILAVGHSARDTYQMLLSHNVELVPKDFSVSSENLMS